MSAPTVLRSATEADLPRILAIYNEAIPLRIATADLEPQTLEARTAWFRNRDLATRPVVVADQCGTVVGWGSFTNFKDRAAYAPTAEISVYVSQSHAGQGIGHALLNMLLERAPGCGIDRILAICFAHNEPSLRLFRSRGFTDWGTLPDACDMDGTRRTIVILGKSLAPTR
ncbi:MAG: N-acetyltransferase family protein [Planctomycetota bacterium]